MRGWNVRAWLRCAAVVPGIAEFLPRRMLAPGLGVVALCVSVCECDVHWKEGGGVYDV